MPFAVARQDGKYHSLWGWVADPNRAFNFMRKEDAEQHVRGQRLSDVTVKKFEAVTPGQPPKMAPFGLENRKSSDG
jgi:hypothetical protein